MVQDAPSLAASAPTSKLVLERPDYRRQGDDLIFNWRGQSLTFTFRELRSGRDGPRSELECSDLTLGWSYSSMLNLLSPTGRASLSKQLAVRFPALPVEALLDRAIAQVLLIHREGEPMVLLDPKLRPAERAYLVRPLAPAAVATLLYGDGSSGKSYLLAALARAVSLGIPLTGMACRPAQVGYLDWEWDQAEHEDRLARLGADCMVPYRACRLPLVDDLRGIARHLDRAEVEVGIIDSLAYALGADPSDPEAVMRFFSALRQLGRTWIIGHHVPRDAKHPYGSVYIRNSVRSAWHMVRSALPEEGGFLAALRHDKSNVGPLERPIGLRFSFGPETTDITRTDARSVPELSEGSGTRERILEALKDQPMDSGGLAEALGIKRHQVQSRLSELKRAERVVRLPDGTWGLLESRYDDSHL